jgi:UDP-perosamine 4-acetyltransferase
MSDDARSAMSAEPVLVVGAGGHAKVVIELIRAGGGQVAALVDADPTPRQVLGCAVVGADEALARLRAEGLSRAFVALGDNRLRARLAQRLRELDFVLVNAVSPGAHISPSARIGAGVAVMAGAAVNAEARIEDLVIVNTCAAVDHDVRLGEACHVGPGSTLAGEVKVGRLAFVGAGATLIPGVSVGDGAVIGAGACVVSDIEAGVLAVGAPARVVRKLDEAGR